MEGVNIAHKSSWSFDPVREIVGRLEASLRRASTIKMARPDPYPPRADLELRSRVLSANSPTHPSGKQVPATGDGPAAPESGRRHCRKLARTSPKLSKSEGRPRSRPPRAALRLADRRAPAAQWSFPGPDEFSPNIAHQVRHFSLALAQLCVKDYLDQRLPRWRRRTGSSLQVLQHHQVNPTPSSGCSRRSMARHIRCRALRTVVAVHDVVRDASPRCHQSALAFGIADPLLVLEHR